MEWQKFILKKKKKAIKKNKTPFSSFDKLD